MNWSSRIGKRSFPGGKLSNAEGSNESEAIGPTRENECTETSGAIPVKKCNPGEEAPPPFPASEKSKVEDLLSQQSPDSDSV